MNKGVKVQPKTLDDFAAADVEQRKKEPPKDLWVILAMDSDNDTGYILEWSEDARNVDLNINGNWSEDALTGIFMPSDLKYPCVVKATLSCGAEQDNQGDYDCWVEASHVETLWQNLCGMAPTK